MLRLNINLQVRRSVLVKCPRHPRYNQEREGAGAIRGGCRYCVAIYELCAGKLAVERSFSVATTNRTMCGVQCGSPVRSIRGAEIDPNSAPCTMGGSMSHPAQYHPEKH